MDNSRIVTATLVGAAVGGAVGYLFFTEHGRTACGRMETALEGFSRDFTKFRNTVLQVAEVASEGWRLLNQAVESTRSTAYPAGQTSPF